jgi:hypothetical protein
MRNPISSFGWFTCVAQVSKSSATARKRDHSLRLKRADPPSRKRGGVAWGEGVEAGCGRKPRAMGYLGYPWLSIEEANMGSRVLSDAGRWLRNAGIAGVRTPLGMDERLVGKLVVNR